MLQPFSISSIDDIYLIRIKMPLDLSWWVMTCIKEVPQLRCLNVYPKPRPNTSWRSYTMVHAAYAWGARTMATRVLRACYYWPTQRIDCADFVKKCQNCRVWFSHTPSPSRLANYQFSKVLCLMEDGYSRSFSTSNWAKKIPASGGGLFH